MAWHTIQEAQQLTGKSRRTLYRDMAAGRLSWEPYGESGRRIETSEMMRAYGALKPLAHPEPEKLAHVGTANGTPDTTLILAELKALREEVAEMRKAMRLIEHKPDPLPTQAPLEASEVLSPEQVSAGKKDGWWNALIRPFQAKK